MNNEVKNAIIAATVALIAGAIVFVIKPAIFTAPPRQPQEIQPTATPTENAPTETTQTTSTVDTAEAATQSSTPTLAASGGFSQGTSTDLITLAGDAIKLELDPHGASVPQLWLTERNDDGTLIFQQKPKSNEPYLAICPIVNGDAVTNSFATTRVIIKELDDRSESLEGVTWAVASQTATSVTFSTTYTQSDKPLFRLLKKYEIVEGKPLVNLSLSAENLSDSQLTLTFAQDGPLGLARETVQMDYRRLCIAEFDGKAISLPEALQRGKVNKKPFDYTAPQGASISYAAYTNRYFGVFMRGILADNATAKTIAKVHVDGIRDANSLAWDDPGDMKMTLSLAPITMNAGEQATTVLEIYAGPKDADLLAKVNPDFADGTKIGYMKAQYAGRSCCCSFDWLARFMGWLLHKIQFVVRNYGLAIMVLVVIIKTCLHPLSVFQQKSMARMQTVMADLQPRIKQIEEKYANDPQMKNKEKMRLMADEGVNPAGQMSAMLPMFLQMPILIALYTAINSDIALRHQPFFFWIKDLAVPDNFWVFDNPVTIPLLGYLPLIGRMFSDIPSLNLLPFLLGVSMYVQQKYMPKPGQKEKHEAAKKQAQETGDLSSFEQQLKQQQTMTVMMSVLMPLMFYYMPAGLTLYFFATNIYGVVETLIIRKQIEEEKERAKRDGPKAVKPRKQGMVSKMMKRMAEQYEEVQRRADQVSDAGQTKKGKGKGKKG